MRFVWSATCSSQGSISISPLPTASQSNIESSFDADQFFLHLNSQFLLSTRRVTDLLEYLPEELQGKNLYNLCHGEDADKLRKSHLDCK